MCTRKNLIPLLLSYEYYHASLIPAYAEYSVYMILCVSCVQALHFKKYSTASDVWSFGAVLYEIWSLGHKPFEEIGNREVSIGQPFIYGFLFCKINDILILVHTPIGFNVL